MNKQIFINWLTKKTDELTSKLPLNLIETKEERAFVDGTILCISEIKCLVEDGKFDD